MTNLPERLQQSEIILYQTEDGKTKIQVRVHAETVWFSLNQMVELFQRDKSVIYRHIRNVFEEGELKPESVVANYATTADDKKRWIECPGGEKFHQRFILTDIGGVEVDPGLDDGNEGESFKVMLLKRKMF